MKEITSRTNPEVKLVTELHDAKGRKKHNMFIAEGLRICKTLVENGFKPLNVYATESQLGDAYSCAPRSACTRVDEHVMERMSAASTPSGLLCVFAIPAAPPIAAIKSGIVCARVADPGNVGTLIRSAAALNTDGVVLIESADAWNPKVVQASAGTIAKIAIIKCSWQELVSQASVPLCALVVHDGQALRDVPRESLLIIGSEAHGIPDAWLTDCAFKATLAMPGGTESLNAAIAGSIALYITRGEF